MFARRAAALLLVLVPLMALACRQAVDVQEALELSDVSSGWFDAGIVNGQNKIVPSVSFRLRQRTDTGLDRVSLNVIFRHPPAPGGDTEDEWDEVYIQYATFENGQTPMLVVRAEKGYTGEQPQSRLDLLHHSLFRDVRARVFAKHGSTQWAELGVIDVERQLLTR